MGGGAGRARPDVRRVSDRLRTLSAGPPGQPPAPPEPSRAADEPRAQAGRAAAFELARAAGALEAAAAGPVGREPRDVPVLSPTSPWVTRSP